MPYIDISKSIRVIYKKLNGEVPERPQDKRAAARGLDDNMWQLLRLCWSKNPNHRASISDLIRRLRYPSSPKGDEVEENKVRGAVSYLDFNLLQTTYGVTDDPRDTPVITCNA